MRRWFLLGGLLVILILLFGCHNETLEQQVVKNTTPTEDIDEPTELVIETKILQEEVTDESGTVLLKGEIQYPAIRHAETSPVLTALNEQFAQAAQDYAKTLHDAEKKEMAQSALIKEGNDFQPFVYQRTFQVTYNANGLLSLLVLSAEHTDGIRLQQKREGQTFCVQTGTLLTWDDFLAGTATENLQLALDGFATQIAADPTAYISNATALLAEQGAAQLEFYLTADALVFFLPENLIGPTAMGFPEWRLAYATENVWQRTIPAVEDKTALANAAIQLILEQVAAGIPNYSQMDVRANLEQEEEIDGQVCLCVRLTEQRAAIQVTLGLYAVNKDLTKIYRYNQVADAYQLFWQEGVDNEKDEVAEA